MPKSSVDPIIAENLRSALAEKGRTAYSVATALGFAPNSLYQVLNGKNGILLPRLRAVAEELGVTLGSLVDEKNAGTMPEGRRDSEGAGTKQVSPQEAIANYQLILDEPKLFLKLSGSSLTVEDMADIANYIRFVREREHREGREEGAVGDRLEGM